MSTGSRPLGPDRGATLISARPLTEYRAMFDLAEGDLAGRVLDCPGGGASFVAEASALGVDAIAVDPAYEQPAERLAPLLLEEVDRGNRYVIEHPELYVWTFFRDPAHHRSLRREGAARFAEHHAHHPERYVAARLPDLPFDDDTFDLVLSSYLLFTYADRLDPDFHLQALLEMARVARGEVRAYPLIDIRAVPSPHLDDLRARLAAAGVASEVRRVPYEFQAGANEMLVLGSTPRA